MDDGLHEAEQAVSPAQSAPKSLLEEAGAWLLENGWKLEVKGATPILNRYSSIRLTSGLAIPLVRACFHSNYKLPHMQPPQVDEEAELFEFQLPKESPLLLSKVIWLAGLSISLDYAQKLVAAGYVFVDGEVARKDSEVIGDRDLMTDITVNCGLADLAPRNIRVELV